MAGCEDRLAQLRAGNCCGPTRLARSRGCADCHGDDFGGRVIADEMPFARLVGPALVRGDAR